MLSSARTVPCARVLAPRAVCVPRPAVLLTAVLLTAAVLTACQGGSGSSGELPEDTTAHDAACGPAGCSDSAADGCPSDPDKTEPGVCGCGTPDDDADDDGRPDCDDACPADPAKTDPGACGCGVPDADGDRDGAFDCNDRCPDDPDKTETGACGCGSPETDEDEDTVADCVDNCPGVDNPGQEDSDEDGTGDACEAECDSDHVLDGADNCPCLDNPGQEDGDDDGVGDACDGCAADPGKTDAGVCGCGVADTDTDGDGAPDCEDGCPLDLDKTDPGVCDCGVADTDGDGDGTADCEDGCPADGGKTAPGVCDCGVADTDGDGDGTPDCADGCPADGGKTAPGACGCGVADADSDGDGTLDCADGCPLDPDKTDPGECGCGEPDTDGDGDGVANCADGCPADPDKTAPGACGCGVADTDGDGDGSPDCTDGCPLDPNKTDAGACGCGVSDANDDGDGAPNCTDGCPADPDKTAPGVCGCGVADTDSDGDGPLDCAEGCPLDPNKTDPGVCGCGVTDADGDGDGTANCIDGCPVDPDKTASGSCGCGVADTDSDGDHVPDCQDDCPFDPNKTEPGACDCGVSDADDDGDGAPDCRDDCPEDPAKAEPGICGCGISDIDTDQDDTADCLDDCPTDPDKIAPGVCDCGTADADTDQDGTEDCLDGCPADPDKIEIGLCGCGTADTDSDLDGTPDCHDDCPADPNKVDPGVCGCGDADTDSDHDGTPDCNDDCPADPDKIEPGACDCGVPDTDGDLDGTPNCNDDCPADPGKVELGVCGCGIADTDTDHDDTPNCNDRCPNDPQKIAPGVCGCGDTDVDTDHDGAPDCIDGCPFDPDKLESGDCGCGSADTPNCDEIAPPSPDPMGWAVAPHPTGTTTVAMTATDASDPSAVEYYFECSDGPGHDSGWQDGNTYADSGLAPDIRYTYRVKARDKSLNQNTTAWSTEETTTTEREGAFASGLDAHFFDFAGSLQGLPNLSGRTADVERIDPRIDYPSTTAPWTGLGSGFADTFASRHTGFLRIEEPGEYTLTLGSDDGAMLWLGGEPVIDTAGAGAMEEVSVVRQLSAGYHPFRVDSYEDRGTAGLILSYSGPGIDPQAIPATALYHASPPDTDPPAPSPTTWSAAPSPIGSETVSMTAAAASDLSGLHYYFECTLGGGHDSGWQYERTYVDTGLPAGRPVAYRVRTRDLSVRENQAAWSTAASCTTDSSVPDLVGAPQALAVEAIVDAALVVGDVTTENNDDLAAGLVISQNPTAGMVVAPGSAVDLVVSLGPVMVEVPDVVGETWLVAETLITGAELRVGDVSVGGSCTIAPGGVAIQVPAAGSSAPKGSGVDIVVSVGPEEVVISEIMYHPEIELAREEFVELYNRCAYPVDLEGWIVEGIGNLTFDAGTTIGPGEYLVLAEDADGFEAAYGFAPDHVYTEGTLDNGGEVLRVVTANGFVADEVPFGDVPPWPVTPDGLGPSLEVIDPAQDNGTARNWHASIDGSGHTAGSVNSVDAEGLPPWISDVRHGTPEPGVPIPVTAFVEDAATVDFTYLIGFGVPVHVAMLDDGLNGDGEAGDGVYGAIIPAQAVGTLVRYRIDAAGATGSMGLPRDDDTVAYTGTYLVDPTLVSNLDIFHWIMDPVDYANAVAHWSTDATEPALLFYQGVLYDGLQVRVRGQSSRSWPKKHWNFKFAKGHGFAGEGYAEVPVSGFNMQSSYADKAYVREVLSYETFRDAGCPSHTAVPVALYQNGQFFGLYTYLEDKDTQYLKRNGVDDNGSLYKAYSQCEYTALGSLPGRFEKKSPEDGDYTDLFEFLSGINLLTGQARRDFIFDNVDIPGMLSYLAASCLIHNNDQVAKNYFLYRDSNGTQRWNMQAWDMDLTFGRSFQGAVLNDVMFADEDDVGRVNVSPSHPLFGDSEHQKWDRLWNRFTDVLYEDPEIREMYYRRLRTVMDELLVEGRYEARIDELAALMANEAEMDRQKWGWYGQSQTLSMAVAILKQDYLAVRRTHLYVTHGVPGEVPEGQSAAPVVVINEIMYNPYDDPNEPVGYGEEKEFVELYNPSPTESVDVSGWTLDGVGLTIPYGSVILPNHYLVVVRNDVVFRAAYGSGHFVAGQYDGALDGSGERLALLDRAGEIVDEVTYGDLLPWPTEPDGAGPSLELIDWSLDNDLPGSWAASEAIGGTPGVENSTTWMAP